jgi:hypothetical protein
MPYQSLLGLAIYSSSSPLYPEYLKHGSRQVVADAHQRIAVGQPGEGEEQHEKYGDSRPGDPAQRSRRTERRPQRAH